MQYRSRQAQRGGTQGKYPPYKAKLHPGQEKVYLNRKRFNILCCGRRWGKTEILKAMSVDAALIKQGPVGWFAPTYKVLAEAWRELQNAMRPYTAGPRSISISEHRIELVTGGTLEMWSLDNPDAGRGRKYARVIIDEAAVVNGLEEAWAESLRPTLTDLKGDAWIASTPRGRNYFWRLYMLGQDEGFPDWQSWQMPTVSNPFIDPAEVEDARKLLPERVFQQEYLAEFMEDSAVFRRIREAATAKRLDSGYPDGKYVMAVDWGKQNDFTVITVFDIATKEQVYLDRFNQIDYVVQLARVKEAVKRFKPTEVKVESNSIGDPLIEQLVRDGIPVAPFHTSNASKLEIIESLTLAFEQGIIKILDDPILIGELQAFTAERLPSGRMRYSAPSGMHDDCVMATALAWDSAKYGVLDVTPIRRGHYGQDDKYRSKDGDRSTTIAYLPRLRAGR